MLHDASLRWPLNPKPQVQDCESAFRITGWTSDLEECSFRVQGLGYGPEVFK